MTEALEPRYRTMRDQVLAIFDKEQAYRIPFDVRLDALTKQGGCRRISECLRQRMPDPCISSPPGTSTSEAREATARYTHRVRGSAERIRARR